jgi:hypothetical protein
MASDKYEQKQLLKPSNPRPYVLAAEAMENCKQAGATPEMQVQVFETTLKHFMDPKNLEELDDVLEWRALQEKHKKT